MVLGSTVMPANFDLVPIKMFLWILHVLPTLRIKYMVVIRTSKNILESLTITISISKDLKIPSYFDELYVQAYTFNGLKDYVFDLNNLNTYISFDFSKNGKWAGKAQVSGAPTNVLYAANSEQDFLVLSTIDYTYQTLPDLLAGTIACAADTVNNIVYYHNSGSMYKYDILAQTHSLAYTGANPFGGGNFPRMEYDHVTSHLFLSNGSTSIKEVDPTNGNVIATYTINGLVNGSGGGDWLSQQAERGI